MNSTTVNAAVAAKAGYKRCALELGGNDPLIVLNDLKAADLEKAAADQVRGKIVFIGSVTRGLGLR